MRIVTWLVAAILALCAPSALAQGVSPAQMFGCNQSAQFNGAAATTVLVARVLGKTTYVCGFNFSGNAAAGTAGLIQGATGGTCPAPTAVTPVFGVGAATNPGVVDHVPFYAGLPPVPPANDLCVVTTGTATQVIVYFTQF